MRLRAASTDVSAASMRVDTALRAIDAHATTERSSARTCASAASMDARQTSTRTASADAILAERDTIVSTRLALLTTDRDAASLNVTDRSMRVDGASDTTRAGMEIQTDARNNVRSRVACDNSADHDCKASRWCAAGAHRRGRWNGNRDHQSRQYDRPVDCIRRCGGDRICLSPGYRPHRVCPTLHITDANHTAPRWQPSNRDCGYRSTRLRGADTRCRDAISGSVAKLHDGDCTIWIAVRGRHQIGELCCCN